MTTPVRSGGAAKSSEPSGRGRRGPRGGGLTLSFRETKGRGSSISKGARSRGCPGLARGCSGAPHAIDLRGVPGHRGDEGTATGVVARGRRRRATSHPPIARVGRGCGRPAHLALDLEYAGPDSVTSNRTCARSEGRDDRLSATKWSMGCRFSGHSVRCQPRVNPARIDVAGLGTQGLASVGATA
jgi:hypothetical protein